MDFDLSEDQQELQAAARSLLDALCTSAEVRKAMDAPEPYDAGLWRAICDQGWLAVALPVEAGGLGLGMVEVAVLAEEIGRHVAPVPFIESWLTLDALARAGGAAAEAWVSRLASGYAVGCVGWASRGGVTADEAQRLTGCTDPSVYAPAADVALVVAGDGLYAVDLVATGTRPAAEPAMDRTRRLGWLRFDATPAVLVGGGDQVVALLDRAATAYSASLLGGAQRVLEMATQYAKDRVQFGRPIGAFQAVKHRLADMVVDVEGMRSATYWAAWCIAADDPERSIAASTAKTWCADAARRVMASGLQVHGGIGFTWEHDLHLFLKRSQLDQLAFGDATFHRDRLARFLRAKVEAGEPVV
jgi:alkylation response protein AidB-like acyl-CoA dehydrogenase